jgi:hypothetical protein
MKTILKYHRKSIPNVSLVRGEVGDLTRGKLTRFDYMLSHKCYYICLPKLLIILS